MAIIKKKIQGVTFGCVVALGSFSKALYQAKGHVQLAHGILNMATGNDRKPWGKQTCTNNQSRWLLVGHFHYWVTHSFKYFFPLSLTTINSSVHLMLKQLRQNRFEPPGNSITLLGEKVMIDAKTYQLAVMCGCQQVRRCKLTNARPTTWAFSLSFFAHSNL